MPRRRFPSPTQYTPVSDEASRGVSAAAALFNNQSIENSGGPLGPAHAPKFQSNAFTPKVSGKLLIMAMISGSSVVVDDTVTVTLLNAALAGVGPTQDVSCGHVGGKFNANVSWIVSGVPLNVATSFYIQASSDGANNLTIPQSGASIVIIELPG